MHLFIFVCYGYFGRSGRFYDSAMCCVCGRYYPVCCCLCYHDALPSPGIYVDMYLLDCICTSLHIACVCVQCPLYWACTRQGGGGYIFSALTSKYIFIKLFQSLELRFYLGLDLGSDRSFILHLSRH